MTCVIGIETRRRIWLGGDSGETWEGVAMARRQPKVWVRRGLAFGVAGNGREADLVTVWKPPRPPKRAGHRWLVKHMIPQLWKVLSRDIVQRYEGKHLIHLLIGLRGKLFSMDSWGGVSRTMLGYDVIGQEMARATALGNLAATEHLLPRERLESALEVASRFVPEVQPPWTIVRVSR